MSIYRKDESGRLVRTAGNTVQRWNDRLFLTTHSVEDGKDYYDIESSANKYILSFADWTEYQLMVTAPNETPNVYFRFNGIALKLERSDMDPISIGQIMNRVSLYTKSLSENIIWMDRLVQPALDTYRGLLTYALQTWDADMILNPQINDTAIALDTNLPYEYDGTDWYISGTEIFASNGWYWTIEFFPDYYFGNGKIIWNGETDSWDISTARVSRPDENTIKTDSLTNTFSVKKVSNKLTINGQEFDGSEVVEVWVESPFDLVLEIESLDELTELEKETITQQVKDNYLTIDSKIDDYLLIVNSESPKIYHYESFWDEDGLFLHLFFRTEDARIELKVYIGEDELGWTYTELYLNSLSIDYEDITGTKPPIDAQKNVQSNWTEEDAGSDAFIKNKPTPLSNANIKTMYEANNDTNAFTDALKSKLDGVQADAQKNSDITKAEIEAKLTGEISSHSHALPSHNHDDRYYTESEVDTKLGGKANTTHNHTKSEITDFPTIPTIPDITVNNGSAESGKYISQVAVDATNKHKLNITKENLPTGFSGNYNDLTNKPIIPTLRPTIELEVASLTTLTEAEKLAIRNTLNTLIVDDKIDGTKFDDIVLVTTSDLIRLHYSSIDYYVANPQITVIFETQSTKYILNVTVVSYEYSTLTSTTTYTKTEIDAMFDNLLGGSY